MEMAILEKEVWVTLNPNNIGYFENLNYIIPRTKDKKGRLTVPRGTNILIKVNDLPEGSNAKLTKICDNDNCKKHIPNQTYNNIIRKRKNGIDLCLNCARVYSWSIRNENISYENSLMAYAKENNKNYLLEEYSDKNEKTTDQINYGSMTKVYWDCPKCNSEYLMEVRDRTCSKNNCPYCAGHRVNHTNSLWTTHPDVAKLLSNSQRGFELTAGSNQKEDFCCKVCNFKQRKIVQSVIKQGFSCLCSDGIKYPEKFMINVLNQINIYYEIQKVFNWSENKRYDFYIPSLNCIIETHGRQHYEDNTFTHLGGKNLAEEQKNDKFKEELAKNNGIINYITVDCSKSNPNFIKNKIIESKLSDLFNLNTINWHQVIESANHSFVKIVCDLWNKGIENATEIGKIIKLNRGTVRKYLKQGVELGWCDYNPKTAIIKNGENNGKKITRMVVQLTKNNEYIKIWNSLIEVQKELKINNSLICDVCRGRHKSTGGFKWMYKEDYEKMINNQKSSN